MGTVAPMAPHPTRTFAVLTSRERAEDARRLLLERELLHGEVEPDARDDGVAFPVTDAEAAREVAAEVGGEVVELEDPAHRTPRDPRVRIRRRLMDELPEDALERVPAGWDRVGDAVLLKLPPELEPHRRVVGAAFGEELGADVVLWDRAGIRGALRTPEPREVLWGSPGPTVHVEDGIRYRLDPQRVMWSSGNVSERVRMGRIDASGETVADLFAGVGYLSLPLAVHGGAERVVAVEKNPTSHGFLEENITLNGVEDVVEARCMDNRDLEGEAWADRVLMGYLPRTERFLPTALRIVKPGGVVHYHDSVHAERGVAEAVGELEAAAAERGLAVEVLGSRVVKSVAPGVEHVVVDARVG